MLQNDWQPNILDRLYQIIFKIIILSQIGADRYQKHIFEILLLSPPWRAVPWRHVNSGDIIVLRFVFDIFVLQHHLAIFFTLIKLKPDITCIDLTAIKSDNLTF